jgi:serine/threonine-protein kinase
MEEVELDEGTPSPTEVQERLNSALADQYAIKGEIGRGGMATVFLAEDLKHHRDVALKVLRPELAAVLGRERFLNEIQVTAKLQHPNILPLFDSGEADGFLYYVMPYVEGESLREKMARESQLSVEEALKIASEVAEALDSAHREGVVHRDIKPENILLREGHALVSDFGIALAVRAAGGDRLTETGLSLGTPAYMSPEQISAEAEIDGRADLYSLACVLYEMLVGEPPFTGPNTQVVLARHAAEQVPSISTARSAVPEPVVTAVERALEKAPADRFDSCTAFSEALEMGTERGKGRPLWRRRGVAAGSLGVLAVAVWGISAWLGGPAMDPEQKSIAVLPFVNLSADPENDHWSDGISIDLIDGLEKLPDLLVAGTNSSFTFKGQNVEIQEVGRRLQVANVLSGTLQRVGDRLRITAQLENVAGGHLLWSEQYDRQLDDIFAIQDEITDAVVEELQISILGSDTGRARERHTENLEAFELFQRGRKLWMQRGQGIQLALEYFQQAVELDPEYALAYAGLADTYAMIAFWGGFSQHRAYVEAKAAARRAIEIDPTLPEPHACLGFIAVYFDWDWTVAEGELLQAIALDPRYVEAYLWLAQYLRYRIGDHEGAIDRLREGHAIEPLSMMTRLHLGAALTWASRPEQGLVEIEGALEQAPNFWYVHQELGVAYRRLSRFEDAVGAFQRSVALSGGHPWALGELAVTHLRAGNTDEARDILEELLQREDSPAYLAWIFFEMGNIDAGFDWVERGYQMRDPLIPALHAHPEVEIDRNDPRYLDLMQRLKLPLE